MTVSKSLGKLVTLGCVHRIEHETDTRAKRVSITEKGKKMVRTLVPIDIKPLVPLLPFIKNKNSWSYVFRYGFLEIDQESFEIITDGMLEFNPLLEEVLDHANKT